MISHWSVEYCPIFNPSKYRLGTLCRRKHQWGHTGKSLRCWNRKKGVSTDCVFCKEFSYNRELDVTKITVPALPFGLFFSNGFTWFGIGDNPLRAFVEYGFQAKEGTTVKVKDECVNGHHWEQVSYGLNRQCRQTECSICRRLEYIVRLDSGQAHAVVKSYRERHPNVIKAVRKRFYWKNRDAVLAFMKTPEERENDRRRQRLRYQRPEVRLKAIQYQHKRRVQKISGIHAPYSPEELASRLANFSGCCAYCGSLLTEGAKNPFHELTWDHVYPLNLGGWDAISNLVPACKSCNSSKNNRDLVEWYKLYCYYDEARLSKVLDAAGYCYRLLTNPEKGQFELPFDLFG